MTIFLSSSPTRTHPSTTVIFSRKLYFLHLNHRFIHPHHRRRRRLIPWSRRKTVKLTIWAIRRRRRRIDSYRRRVLFFFFLFLFCFYVFDFLFNKNFLLNLLIIENQFSRFLVYLCVCVCVCVWIDNLFLFLFVFFPH